MASDNSDSDDVPETLNNSIQKEKVLQQSNAIKKVMKIKQSAIKEKRRKINDLLVQQKKTRVIDEIPKFSDEMLQIARELVIKPKAESIKGNHTRLSDHESATRKVIEYQFGNIKIMPLTRRTQRPISTAIKEFQESALSRTRRRSNLGKRNYGPAPFFKIR